MDDPAIAPTSLSLQPWPKNGEEQEPLDHIIGRMFQQRGHLRHLTEEGLEREITDERAARAAAEAEAALEEASEDEDEQDDRKKREAVYGARMDMLRSVYTAHQAVLYALDFTSFLLTKNLGKRAESSMSPALKAAVPPGTLSYDMWPTTEPSGAQRKDEGVVSRGWRMNALNSAADSLLHAATRVEEEVKKETKYWEQVLSISEKGWSVRRLTRESHTLEVQFGFSEAGQQFKERGFAVLRTDEENNIILDQGLTRVPKAVRARIVRDGKIVGTSTTPSLSSGSGASVEDLIHRARDSLFEEELFHEIMLETRNLISLDVKVRESTVHVPVPPCDALSLSSGDSGNHEVLIDLAPLDGSVVLQSDQQPHATADYIAVALRLMLSHTHRQRLHRRSQIPPPLSDQKRRNSPPSILRPVLNHLQHHTATNSIRRYASNTASVLRSAGLAFDTDMETELKLSTLVDSSRSHMASSSPSSTTNDLITTLTGPLLTIATLSLPSSNTNKTQPESLRISITTRLSPPTFGTEYTLTLPFALSSLLFSTDALPSSGSKRLTFTSFGELTSYLDFLLSVDVAHNIIVAENEGWRGVEGEAEVLRTVEVEEARRTRKVGLQLGEGRMVVYWRWMDQLEKHGEVSWDGRRNGDVKGLREVLKEFIT